MKQCGRCGTQNLDQQTACSACGFALPAAAAPHLGGTLLMAPGGGSAVSPLAATESAAPAPPPAAAPLNLNRTMLGIAPPAIVPPVGAAPVASTPPPAAPGAAPAGSPARNFGGTMIGMAPPLATPPASQEPPQQAAATDPSAAKLTSAQKTMLGVARPGIAPLNPGQPKPPPQVSPAAPAPGWPPPPEPGLAAPISPRAKGARISVGATLAMVGAGMLLVMAVMTFFMLRGRGNVTARAGLDAKGQEVLELSCSECPDDTRTWIDGAAVAFRDGKATLPLQTQLKVGENPLVLVLERPGRSREEIALSIPIEFRVRGSTDELAQDPPRVAVVASALAGTKLEVDGKPVTPGADGSARLDYDVSAEVTGPEASLKMLERAIPYKATSAQGGEQSGQVEIRIGVTPLVVDAPGTSIVVDRKELVIAGRTAPGSILRVGAQNVTLDPEGRFVSKQALAPGENKLTVRATLKDHAPRLVHVSVRRSDDLQREAALARAMAETTYADVLRLGDRAAGRSVALSGQLFDLRHDGYSSVLLLDVKDGCRKSPCLVKLIYGTEARLEKGRELKAFGKVVRFVDGPRTGQRIPEIRADLIAAGAP